jgi:FkbM family methyltransferase
MAILRLACYLMLFVVAEFQELFEPGSHSKIKKCKHGLFLLNDYDLDISKTLDVFGEWSELELDLFKQIVKPGDVVVDAGANIGAFTVPLAKAVGPKGVVHAFEPQRIINQRLNANIALNDLLNVRTYFAALGKNEGEVSIPQLDYATDSNFGAFSIVSEVDGIENAWLYSVPLKTLDSIDYYNYNTKSECPSLIKMDVEMMEKPILQGGANTLAKCKPVVFVENNNEKTSEGLVLQLYDMDYVPFWHITSAFNPNNFYGAPRQPPQDKEHFNMNMVCIHKSYLPVNGGNLTMINFVQVEKDRPFLYQYFTVNNEDGTVSGKYRQYH